MLTIDRGAKAHCGCGDKDLLAKCQHCAVAEGSVPRDDNLGPASNWSRCVHCEAQNLVLSWSRIFPRVLKRLGWQGDAVYPLAAVSKDRKFVLNTKLASQHFKGAALDHQVIRNGKLHDQTGSGNPFWCWLPTEVWPLSVNSGCEGYGLDWTSGRVANRTLL